MIGSLKHYLLAFLIGLVGLFVGLLVIHAWNDHKALHVMLDFLNQHGQAIRSLTPPK
jgi:hypothetical protein